ncbi:hypothetical protein FPOAC1_005046 [Fusarium poae]|uniref:hypothetical protein n=1 Tax=Fusarium poae TaxID=36050 RepID=UPI001CE95094|nr:hypothetical protein FPOAC1_005046 [Fusarium poae]KAG8671788.1 hypothetical protein FPOAC1_005046 [Fusarium poae]
MTSPPGSQSSPTSVTFLHGCMKGLHQVARRTRDRADRHSWTLWPWHVFCPCISGQTTWYGLDRPVFLSIHTSPAFFQKAKLAKRLALEAHLGPACTVLHSTALRSRRLD